MKNGQWRFRVNYIMSSHHEDSRRRPNIVRVIWLTLSVLLLCLAASVHADDSSVATAFTHVTVVPMDFDRTIVGQTVLVTDGLIAAIGADGTIEIPPGTTEIDGTGKYLMPGLADMHVHIFSEDELPLYVMNGVTVVRNMWGWSMHLELRERIERGELLGPQIYTAGALIDGDPPRLRGAAVARTPQEAERIVAEQIRDGYDFVKVYDRLKPEVFGAIILVGKMSGMPVAGHVPTDVGIYAALASGMNSVEHLKGYAAGLAGDTIITNWSSELDTLQMIRLARTTRHAGVWNVPTLVVLEQQDMSAAESEEFLQQPRLQQIPNMLRRFCCSEPYDPADDLEPPVRQRRKENRFRMVRALAREGAGLLVGTDTGNPFVLPGYSIHEELKLLVEAGLTPFACLSGATRLASEFMKDGEIWGTVEVGKRADLLLLSGNPLDDVTVTASPEGVMIRGEWLPAEKLHSMADELAAKHGD